MTRISMVKIEKLVLAFEEAVREHAFMGAQPTQARYEIELDYQEAKQRLLDAMKRGPAK